MTQSLESSVIELDADVNNLKKLIPTGDSMQVLKKFENRYQFNRHDNLVYFITWDLEQVTSYNQKIKVKFGRSDGAFDKRWQSYCCHTTTMPYIIAVITIPEMEHYKLFYPDTEIKDIPNVFNEEKNIKKIFKDRVYYAKSKEKVMVSMHEIYCYYNKRQDEINKMSNEYDIDYNMWRLPIKDKDGNLKCRIEYFTKLDKENAEREYKEKEEEKEKNKPLPLRKLGEKMSKELIDKLDKKK